MDRTWSEQVRTCSVGVQFLPIDGAIRGQGVAYHLAEDHYHRLLITNLGRYVSVFYESHSLTALHFDSSIDIQFKIIPCTPITKHSSTRTRPITSTINPKIIMFDVDLEQSDSNTSGTSPMVDGGLVLATKKQKAFILCWLFFGFRVEPPNFEVTTTSPLTEALKDILLIRDCIRIEHCDIIGYYTMAISNATMLRLSTDEYIARFIVSHIEDEMAQIAIATIRVDAVTVSSNRFISCSVSSDSLNKSQYNLEETRQLHSKIQHCANHGKFPNVIIRLMDIIRSDKQPIDHTQRLLLRREDPPLPVKGLALLDDPY